MLGLGVAVSPLQFCTSPSKESVATESEPLLSEFGIQLYSVKEDMAIDPAGTMRKLASYGYKQFEGFDGGKGILWGMSPEEFNGLLNEIGAKMVATHCNVFENLEEQAQHALQTGIQYLICPWIGPQKSIEEYKKIAAEFNQIGEKLNALGLKFAYHNHDYTFVELEGQMPQDVLMTETNPEWVDFEMDMYWVYVAGIDPKDYLSKYPSRFKLCHVKDAIPGPGDPHQRGTLLGQGEIPYSDLIAQSQGLGMEFFIVEQEQFPSGTPLEAAEANAVYLSGLQKS